MTSPTTKTSANVASAVKGVSDAEAKHAAAIAELPAIEERVRKADAELKRIEQCIADDEPTAGLDDLTKADAELRFFKLQHQAKSRAATVAGGAVQAARTALVRARLEAGEYGIHMDRLRPEAEALASKIAALLTEHVALCAAHNEGRLRLLADAKESDAANDQGTGNPASSLAWGHEDQKRYKPVWIEVDGEPVPEVHGRGRWEAIQRRAEWIVLFGEEVAAKSETSYIY
ncbi:hypothetical protein OIT41_15745 [Arthrobacter sp. YA7-1]|uniref:hypothetical protein n=1 Tax=Arthrobacter sp. YA7-1 TaxID=2987701 RepID=UPI002226452B|nr:hypothetical protein [Arthrobacter sp. YA7-1]UYY80750.1 hypothetical protein OIT41_15745 [Arthrobacter sp. YA7-1]